MQRPQEAARLHLGRPATTELGRRGPRAPDDGADAGAAHAAASPRRPPPAPGGTVPASGTRPVRASVRRRRGWSAPRGRRCRPRGRGGGRGRGRPPRPGSPVTTTARQSGRSLGSGVVYQGTAVRSRASSSPGASHSTVVTCRAMSKAVSSTHTGRPQPGGVCTEPAAQPQRRRGSARRARPGPPPGQPSASGRARRRCASGAARPPSPAA